MTTFDSSVFWDYKQTLTFNALLNFIIGNRGGGKSYGAKKFVINRFLKKGEQFIYLRRFKSEFKEKSTFFNDISEEFPETEFQVKGFKAKINKEVAGYFIPLSTSKIEKSVSFPKVTTIIFDEFIIEKGYHHYLRNEISYFLDFIETVARSRDNVRVLLLANAITVTNPYFLYFNVQVPKIPPNGQIARKYYKDKSILIELVQNEDFIKLKKQTRFGKLIAGTEYGDYAIENKFLCDNYGFIEKKSGRCYCIFSFSYNNNIYGVWKLIEKDKEKIYISNDYDEKRQMFALTLKDMEIDRILFINLKKTSFSIIERALKYGRLYFEDINIKNTMMEILRLYYNFKNVD